MVYCTFTRIFSLPMQAVYFAKRHAEPIKKESFHSQVMFGDLCNIPLEHLTSLVETVCGTNNYSRAIWT